MKIEREKMIKEKMEEMWGECPEIYKTLVERDLDDARKVLAAYLEDLEWKYRSGEKKVHPLDWATAIEGLWAFKNLISPCFENLAGFSTLENLQALARNDVGSAEEGFIEEFNHLFRAINGKSRISEGWLGPILEGEGVKTIDFSEIEGRAAGIARSDYLDRVAERMSERIDRFPSGMDAALIEKMKKNREKILKYFGAAIDEWNDVRWQNQHIFRDVNGLEHLKNLVPLTEEDVKAIELSIKNQIPWGISPYYLSLFDFDSAGRGEDYQVRSQVIPPMHYVERMIKHHGDREYYFDFMGEHDTSPSDLITRRYPCVAILKASDTCPQICVYCQRNWEITGPMMKDGIPPMEKIDAALDWFEEHRAMRDVLVTGGDPFVLNDRSIEHMMDRLSSMEHIVNVRWGTRIPVTMPMRITEDFAEMLGSYIDPGVRDVAVVTHVESAYEVTPDLAAAISRLRENRIYVYNQQVFTLETSRRFQTVATRIALRKVGIDPYYTFYAKGKEEHKDYLVPIARIAQEKKEEARLLPGIFRTDESVFNVPRLGKSHIRAWQDREVIAIRDDGSRVYLVYPWEKGIAPVDPWTYVDVPIYRYLKEMETRGEKLEDYESIWYYY
jgi:lysine 2,3-aminomutase